MTDKEYADKEKASFDESKIPVEFRSALSYLAYERGHAYGFDEIWSELTDLVSGLQEPIEKYTRRIQNEKEVKSLKKKGAIELSCTPWEQR